MAKQFGGVEVLCKTDALAIQHSVATRCSEDFVLFPTYLGRRVIKFIGSGIPAEWDLGRVLACVVFEGSG